jgi:two-component system alkaline phosphatase synthesis response regulator PhoP
MLWLGFVVVVRFENVELRDNARTSSARQLATTEPNSSQQMATTEPSISNSRLLIADDNQQNRELLEAYLVGEGYTIEMAVDGQETIERVTEFAPDLILLDIMMPRMSGYEVAEQLKSDDETKDIPILMVTALNEMGDIERGVKAGCDDFLTKPVNRLELQTRVRSLLRVRHLTNERDRLLAYLAEVDRQE